MSSVYRSSGSSMVSWQSYRPTYLTEPDPKVLGIIKENLKSCPSIKSDFFDRLKTCDSLLKQALQWEYEKTQNILEGRAQGTIEASGMTNHFQEQLFKIGEEVTRWDDKDLIKIISNQDIQNLRNSSLVMGFHHSDPNDPILSTNDRMPSYEEFVARGIIEEAHEPHSPSSSCYFSSESAKLLDPNLTLEEIRSICLRCISFDAVAVKNLLQKKRSEDQLEICKKIRDFIIENRDGLLPNFNTIVLMMCGSKITYYEKEELLPLYLKGIGRSPKVKARLESFEYPEQLQICKEVQDWNILEPLGLDNCPFILITRVGHICNVKKKRLAQGKPFAHFPS